MGLDYTTDPVTGAGIRVETGIGRITKIDQGEGKRNAHVFIDAEHLREEVRGWVDTHDPLLYPRVYDAWMNEKRVTYRIVTRRKAAVAAATPIDSVGTRQKVRDLEAMELAPRAAQGTASAPSAPAQPSQAPPSPPAPVQRPSEAVQPPAANPSAERQPPQSGAASGVGVTGGAPAGRRGPKLAEGRPWEGLNSDGSLNLGSYEVLAAEGMVQLAHGLVLAAAAGGQISEDKRGNLRAVGALAARLLRAADLAQASIRGDGYVDRMAVSHTRARGAVRAAVEVYPVPWDRSSDVATTEAWVQSLAEYAAGMVSIAAGFVQAGPNVGNGAR